MNTKGSFVSVGAALWESSLLSSSTTPPLSRALNGPEGGGWGWAMSNGYSAHIYPHDTGIWS